MTAETFTPEHVRPGKREKGPPPFLRREMERMAQPSPARPKPKFDLAVGQRVRIDRHEFWPALVGTHATIALMPSRDGDAYTLSCDIDPAAAWGAYDGDITPINEPARAKTEHWVEYDKPSEGYEPYADYLKWEAGMKDGPTS